MDVLINGKWLADIHWTAAAFGPYLWLAWGAAAVATEVVNQATGSGVLAVVVGVLVGWRLGKLSVDANIEWAAKREAKAGRVTTV